VCNDKLESFAGRVIKEAKQLSQRLEVGSSDVCPKIRASEDTLSRWSRLHLQSLALTNVRTWPVVLVD
jgi:hypothetical protein